MGLDERSMPVRLLKVLPDRLRDAGFDVEFVVESGPDPAVTVLKSRRGPDTQLLTWCDEPDISDVCHIYIPNAWAWRRHVHERRTAIQAQVAAIIEENGGYATPCAKSD